MAVQATRNADTIDGMCRQYDGVRLGCTAIVPSANCGLAQRPELLSARLNITPGVAAARGPGRVVVVGVVDDPPDGCNCPAATRSCRC